MAKKVLLVDDDPVCLRVHHKYLSDAGFEVVSASSGKEALACLRLPKMRIALAIIDRLLMDMQGEALMRTMRQMPAHADTPCVMITGHANADEFLSAIEQGAADFLYKPVRQPLLLHVMNQALGNLAE